MPHSFRRLLVASTLGVFVGFALCGAAAAQPAKPTTKDDPNAAQNAAVAAITRLGGQVTFDTKSPDRSVTGVRLFGPTITDAHLVHLKALTSLQTLDLTETKVTGAGLVHLQGLTSLQVLRLDRADVTDAGLMYLKGLTSLTTLGLGYKITDAGLEHLKGLMKLQTLYFTQAPITDAGLVHLKPLTNLKVLQLYGAQVTDAGLVHLKGLTSLETLILYTQVTDAGLVHLKGLPKLQVLHLDGAKFTDAGLVHLKGLTSLQTLYLISTKVTGAGLVHLKELTSLQGLYLNYSPVTDAGLVHVKELTSLQTLGLHGTQVSDASMERLFGLTKLQTVYLNNTKVTRAGVWVLQTALPKCHIGHQWTPNWPPFADAAKTEHASGLRISVEAAKATYTVGEKVTLQLLIKNVGDKDKQMYWHDYDDKQCFPHVHLLVTTSDERTAGFTMPSKLPIHALKLDPDRTIKVGESVRLKTVLNNWDFEGAASGQYTAGKLILSRPGKYTLRAVYYDYPPLDLQKYPFSPPPVSPSVVQSPPVTVTIVAKDVKPAP